MWALVSEMFGTFANSANCIRYQDPLYVTNKNALFGENPYLNMDTNQCDGKDHTKAFGVARDILRLRKKLGIRRAAIIVGRESVAATSEATIIKTSIADRERSSSAILRPLRICLISLSSRNRHLISLKKENKLCARKINFS
jgi:hypothetical protein